MSTLTFSKYQGAGNDFIVIDNRALFFDPVAVPALCNRKFGIGADGVLLLEHGTSAPFRMRIFNCDGSEAPTCGNGLRCLSRFLHDLGHPSPYQIESAGHIVTTTLHNDLIETLLCPLPSLQTIAPDILLTHTGNPHLVVFKPFSLELAKHFRHQYNANVNFVQGNYVRTFERGLEAESLACGSGAAAVFAATQRYDEPLTLHFPGGTLVVSLKNNQIAISGRADRVFSGNYGKVLEPVRPALH